jgi:16S rRNA (cytosine967-C5)-methyltransferase
MQRGEEFNSSDRFDLIIVDAPCSNSGVFNKRPEARWRLSEDALCALEKSQLALLRHAVTLLAPEGEIWFMTCSILDSENEAVINKLCSELPLEVRKSMTILPSADGWDGGYACALRIKKERP